jgi:cardiolipin synthase (CMP-forming)
MKLFNIPLHIPNILSLYRLLSAPFILLLIYLGYEKTFVTLFIINQVSDILDGYIARKYKLESEIGSLLDSYADIGSYVIAFAGIWQFHPYLFRSSYCLWLLAFAVLYILAMVIAKIKFKRAAAGLHLYSSKITGYVQGSFLVILFVYGLIPTFFYVMIVFGILAELEVIAINLISSKPILNAKGIYWVLKERRLKN